MARLPQNLLVTLCAATRTTERAAKRRGVGYFLPALFIDRFTKMGGVDRDLFAAQMFECRSFEDEAWARYWTGFASGLMLEADTALARLDGPRVAHLLDPDRDDVIEQLRAGIAPASRLFADRTAASAAAFADAHPEHADAALALDKLMQAMTYLFAACWPGWTPRRMEAYTKMRRLFDVLVRALAPALQVDVETFTIPVGDDAVKGYAILPSGAARSAGILLTNGLEGSIEELALPAMRHQQRDAALFIIEMPGTFTYTQPLSVDSEAYYHAVIDHMAAHPRIDAERLGMLGVSFGAHWSTRMAARDRRLKAVVSNGGLYHHAFSPKASFGMPEIMISTLTAAVGARNQLDMGKKLEALSLHDLMSKISIPILAVNGDNDTLIPTQDTIDLANAAPLGELKLYPGDDHCAMAHYNDAITDATAWLLKHLAEAR